MYSPRTNVRVPFRGAVLAAAVVSFLGVLSTLCYADISLPSPFHDGMSLPCSSPIAIWGSGAPGEAVSVAFGDRTVATKADDKGNWTAYLEPLEVSRRGRDLTITGANQVTFHKVTVANEDIAGTPLWIGGAMENEPLLFIQEEGHPWATATLLFAPTGDLRIADASESTVYEARRDYTWQPQTKTVTLTPQSRIPFKTHAEMYPTVGSPNVFGAIGATGTGTLWHEGNFFHQLQVCISYKHSERWDGLVPPSAGGRLQRSLAKLKSKAPFKIVALGDSITQGYNASGLPQVNAPPFQPPYPDLVAAGLRHRFGAPVSLVNLAVAGTGAEWGFSRVADVVAQKPDLVILAFGMNDGDPAPFAASIAKTLAALHDGCPGADVVLVASMLGNPDIFQPAGFEGRRDALLKLQSDNIAVADVTSFWEDLTKRKPFSSLTGNNVNHPNDFSHRVYASVILALFGDTEKHRP